MSQPSSKLRVAISGGGLAGASLFHALLRQPSIDVHIFESAPAFREAGAAVGLGRNAQSALELIGPSAVQCFERAGAVSQKGVRIILAQGPDTGKIVARVGGDSDVVGIVHRAEFLKELLAEAPEDCLHASKKLQKIEQAGEKGPITITFTDGTTHECDVLIGADGINSNVRKYVLGDSDPAASAVPAGWWLVQVLKPYDEAAKYLEKPHFDKDSPGEICWMGDGALIFHNILSDKNLAQFVVVVSCPTDNSSSDWFKTVESDDIRKVFTKWPCNLQTAVEKLICDEKSHTSIYFWQHLPALSYTRGNVSLTGDAAHATTPWQGAGAGQSVEDSLILSTLLSKAKSPTEARVALKIYDAVRRPRSQRVVESSKGTGLIVTNGDEETGLDAAKLENKLRPRWDWLLDFDVTAHRDDALRQMESEIKAHLDLRHCE